MFIAMILKLLYEKVALFIQPNPTRKPSFPPTWNVVTLGIRNVIIETDSELVEGRIRKNLCSPWYLWDFWEYLQEELQGLYFSIMHIFWEGNQIANYLAKTNEGGNT